MLETLRLNNILFLDIETVPQYPKFEDVPAPFSDLWEKKFASIRKNPKLFYRQVTSRDLWIEDPASPNYNRHVVIDHEPATAWEKKQQMKQANDDAHALKLFIAHNAPPHATPGGGSSIFFHIWRGGGSKPTAGCTTMPEEKLRWLIARIDPDRNPVYVLLTEADYQAKREVWGLP